MAGELAVRRPHAALRGFVRAYHGYAESSAAPVTRREVPGGRAVLILGFEPLQVRDGGGPWRTFGSFAAGMHLAPAFTAHCGSMAGLEVELTPLGARALLGVPMAELTGVTVALHDVWSERLARELTEAAATGADWDARVGIVQRELLRRAAAAPPLPVELQWAYASLLRRPVAGIARELGWSQRRLVAAFREHVGLAPKAAARVLRFERALAVLRRGEPAAAAALLAGYADQAHMTREFAALAGTTPSRLVSGDFLQDALRAGP